MSSAFRIIPRLDIKGPNIVKGINLEGLRVLGKPEDFAKFYYENGADELIYQDVVASLYGRNSLKEMISKTAKEIFIPLTVGGGIQNLEDILSILRSGADKVCINTAALNDPNFITKACQKFGASTIVIGIEAIKQENGKYMAFTDNGRNATNKSALDWAKEVAQRGAGEIVITCVDKEGLGNGSDLDFITQISKAVNIPVVAHGGVGSIKDVLDLSKIDNLSGASIASLFHYNFIEKNRVLEGYEEEGNTQFLQSRLVPSNIHSSSIKDLKEFLKRNKVTVRSQ